MSETTHCPYCNAKLRISKAHKRPNRVKCSVCRNYFHPSHVTPTDGARSLNEPLIASATDSVEPPDSNGDSPAIAVGDLPPPDPESIDAEVIKAAFPEEKRSRRPSRRKSSESPPDRRSHRGRMATTGGSRWSRIDRGGLVLHASRPGSDREKRSADPHGRQCAIGAIEIRAGGRLRAQAAASPPDRFVGTSQRRRSPRMDRFSRRRHGSNDRLESRSRTIAVFRILVPDRGHRRPVGDRVRRTASSIGKSSILPELDGSGCIYVDACSGKRLADASRFALRAEDGAGGAPT